MPLPWHVYNGPGPADLKSKLFSCMKKKIIQISSPKGPWKTLEQMKKGHLVGHTSGKRDPHDIIYGKAVPSHNAFWQVFCEMGLS